MRTLGLFGSRERAARLAAAKRERSGAVGPSSISLGNPSQDGRGVTNPFGHDGRRSVEWS